MFTEDFFDINGKYGVLTERYRDIRGAFKFVHHRKGERAEQRAGENTILFDIEIVIIRKNFTCFSTNFQELIEGPFGFGAIVPGEGGELVDAQKAKFMVDSFFSEKQEQGFSIQTMLSERKGRQMVLVAEKPADLKRPSLEPIRKLRTALCTILINPDKGPVVDCQVAKLYQEGNSNSFSSLLSLLCVKYK